MKVNDWLYNEKMKILIHLLSENEAGWRGEVISLRYSKIYITGVDSKFLEKCEVIDKKESDKLVGDVEIVFTDKYGREISKEQYDEKLGYENGEIDTLDYLNLIAERKK